MNELEAKWTRAMALHFENILIVLMERIFEILCSDFENYGIGAKMETKIL